MKESIANSYVFMIIIIFISVIALVFVSSLSYSKAFKVKNKILDIIEQYDDGYGYNSSTRTYANKETIEKDIEAELKDIGYRISNNRTCPTRTTKSGNVLYAINNQENYRYCVYRESQGRGEQYYVVVYMYFDVPIIDRYLEFPLSGQTKVFYQTIDNHHKCVTNSDCGDKQCVSGICR